MSRFRLISLLVALVFGVSGSVFVAPGVATAADPMWSSVPAPFDCKAGSNSCVAHTGFNPNVSTWGQDTNALGNCTNYAAYRLQRNGAVQLAERGNAITWADRVRRQFGEGAVNTTPVVGSIAWWGSSKGAAGHVAYVEQVDGSTIYISDSSYNIGSARYTKVVGQKTGYPEAFLHIKDLSPHENKLVRRSDGKVSWVVINGQRQHVPTYAADLCAQWAPRREVIGLSDAEIAKIPEVATKFACDLNDKVLRAASKPAPTPSYAYYGGKYHAIQDGQTYSHFTKQKAWPIVNVADVAGLDGDSAIKKLENGGAEPLRLNAGDQENKILRRTDGVSWVVTAGARRHIPAYTTDLCARWSGSGRQEVTGLVQSQVESMPESTTKFGCNLNNSVLRAVDRPEPRPSYAFYGDKRHTIKDSQTFAHYREQRGFKLLDVGAKPGLDADAAIRKLADAGVEPLRLNVRDQENRVLRRSDGVSWLVTAGKRHHIPNYPTYVCAMWSGNGRALLIDLVASQVDSIPEDTQNKVACDLNNKVLKAADHQDPKPSYAYYGGKWHHIKDAQTYAHYTQQRGWPVINVRNSPGKSSNDAIRRLSAAGDEPLRLNARDQEQRILRRKDGVSWLVVGGRRFHIPTYATDLCAHWSGGGRAEVNGLVDSQAASIPEAPSKAVCELNNTVLRAADKADPKPAFAYYGDRWHSIKDGQTYAHYTQQKAWPVINVRSVPGLDSVQAIRTLTGAGDEPLRINAKDQEGRILRRTDGVSWVVTGGVRRHIPNYVTDVCAQYRQRRTEVPGLNSTQAGSIPEVAEKFACNLNGSILRGADQPHPKPSYVFRDGKRFAIPDGWTYDFYVRRGFTVVDLPHSRITDGRLPNGGAEVHRLDPASIPANSVVRGSNGVTWVVDAQKSRHKIPYQQDEVCWRFLRNLPVVATNLTEGQLAALPAKDNWPCIIGPRMVKSDDTSSWYVDSSNTRHWIPDGDTYHQLIRNLGLPVVGPWPAAEIGRIPRGADQPRLIDKEAVKNSIICRGDGVCWSVDSSAVRHHIPTYGDNVCWRWVNGWSVTRNGLSAEQASSLPEGESRGCSLGNRIIATNERPAYFMEDNTRRWIEDGYDFDCLSRGRTVIRGMSLSEAGGLPEGQKMPAQECAGIDIVTIYSPAAKRYVTTEIQFGGSHQAMIRAARTEVGSDWERFRLIGNCASRCLIQSLNNRKLVLAQFNYEGPAWGELRGVSDNAGGSWEGFRLEGDCRSGCAIRALGWTQDVRYVSAELNYENEGKGMLRARATKVGGWERFVIS